MTKIKTKQNNIKSVHINKMALFDYEIIQNYEAGIKLTGKEVKSIRLGHCNLKGSYVSLQTGVPLIKLFHISTETNDTKNDKADRIVLLKKDDIIYLNNKFKEKGYSLIPTEVYLKGNLIKINIALAKGRKTFEKKQFLKERDILMDAKREISRF